MATPMTDVAQAAREVIDRLWFEVGGSLETFEAKFNDAFNSRACVPVPFRSLYRKVRKLRREIEATGEAIRQQADACDESIEIAITEGGVK